MRVVAPLLILFTLGACATTAQVKISSISPVCEALIGPIKYNTFVKTSPRYAGRVLAQDLKQRNQVGVNLKCPAYRY